MCYIISNMPPKKKQPIVESDNDTSSEEESVKDSTEENSVKSDDSQQDEEEYEDEEEDEEEGEEDEEDDCGEDDEIEVDDCICKDDDKYIYNGKKETPKDERISKPIMTQYEYTRILAERIAQLSDNAVPLIKNVDNLPHMEIARMEIKKSILPFKIQRPMPNGSFEIWHLEELDKSHI